MYLAQTMQKHIKKNEFTASSSRIEVIIIGSILLEL